MEISAIIPTYNYARYVTRAVDSALHQTYPLAEVIVVDDGSTDNTREVLSAYGDRIRYVYQENRGLAGARNTGIRNARSPWVAYLDSDDTWFPEKIERQVKVVEADPAVELVYTSLRICYTDGRTEDAIANPPDQLWPRFRWANSITPSTVMMRRDLALKAGGFDESLRYCEDWEMWSRLGPHIRYGAALDPLIGYQMTPGSLSSNVTKELATAERVVEKTVLKGLQGWRRAYWRRVAMSAVIFRASVACRTSDPASSRRYLAQSLQRWPSPFFMPERWKSIAWECRRSLGPSDAPATRQS
jgi:glycosyltransferase involved in cell wall biosynthesis